jgi:hypothetical protein
MPSLLQLKNKRVMDQTKGKIIHPDSRRVRQMRRTMRRNLQVDQTKARNKNLRTVQARRHAWFRDALQAVGGLGVPSAVMVAALAELHVRRNDVELAELKASRNPPRGQIKLIEDGRRSETEQLMSSKGLQVPIVTTQEGLHALMTWDGKDESATKVHCEGVSRTRFSPEETAGVRALMEEFRAKLEPADEAEEAQAKLPNIAERRRQLAKRLTDKKGAKGSLGGIRTDQATGRRMASQVKQAALRRHRQLAMSRGLLN